MKLFKNLKKGFTLVELVVVIAVIAILAALSVVSYIGVTNKAKAAADSEIITQLNTQMRSKSIMEGPNKTAYEAYLDAREIGFNLELMKPSSSGKFVWDQENDLFACVEVEKDSLGKVIAEDKSKSFVNNASKTWVYTSSINESAEYCQYLNSKDKNENVIKAPATINIRSGFDAGENMTVKAIEYESNAGHSIVIRTNSKESTLQVKAPSDIIYHYDVVGSVNIIECKTSSYHECGEVEFLEIAKGRVALEKGADVGKLHFDAKTVSDFDEIIVAADPSVTLPEFSRDDVTIPEGGTLVVELQKDTNNNEKTDKDYIWLYQQGLVQQIRISESATQISDVKATDAGVDAKTAKAADEIANNLRQGANYTSTQINSGEVADNDVIKTGLSETEKNEIKQEIKDAAEAQRITEEKKDDINAVAWNKTTNTYYNDLYEAFASVDSEGTKTTIVLLKDVFGVSNRNYQILENQNVVFDLNGHTFNTVAADSKTAYAIENKGTLTIKDNTDKAKDGTGTGKIELRAIDPDLKTVPSYASNVLTNFGVLTIESGLIYNASTKGGAAFAIDTRAGSELYFKGGMADANASSAVRLYRANVNSALIKAEFTGGVIHSAGGGDIWVQTDATGPIQILLDGVTCKDCGYNYAFYEASVNTPSFEGIEWIVKSGVFEDNVYVDSKIIISGGTYKGSVNLTSNDAAITGGTFIGPYVKKDWVYGEAYRSYGGKTKAEWEAEYPGDIVIDYPGYEGKNPQEYYRILSWDVAPTLNLSDGYVLTQNADKTWSVVKAKYKVLYNDYAYINSWPVGNDDPVYIDIWKMYGDYDAANWGQVPRYLLITDTTSYSDGTYSYSGKGYFDDYFAEGAKWDGYQKSYLVQAASVCAYFETEAEANAFQAEHGGTVSAIV